MERVGGREIIGTCKFQPLYHGWKTLLRLVWLKAQISYMFWEFCVCKTHAKTLPSAATLHHSNMPFPREDVGVLYMNSSCVQHILKLRGKQMKAKQEGYPESRPLHFPGIFLSCGVGTLLENVTWKMSVSTSIKLSTAENKHTEFYMLLTSSFIWL